MLRKGGDDVCNRAWWRLALVASCGVVLTGQTALAALWTVRQLTDNDCEDYLPQVSCSDVAWVARCPRPDSGYGFLYELNLYDGAGIRELDRTPVGIDSPLITGDRVAASPWL